MLKNLLFKQKKPADVKPHNDIDVIFNSEKVQNYITTIKDLLISDTADSLAEKITLRLLRHIWFLPASEGHHHSEEFGLFYHCLECGIESVKRFDDKIYFEFRDNKDIDSFDTRHRRPRMQYAFFLAGLLHDMGKDASRFEIKSRDGHVWNPCSPDGLYGFVQKYGINFSDIKFLQHKNMYGGMYRKLAPFFASRLLSPGDYEYVGAEEIGEVINAIGYKPYTDNIFKFYLTSAVTEADMQTVQRNIEEKPQQIKDVVVDLIEMLKGLLTSGQVPINSRGAKAWVFDTFTAVQISVINDVRQKLYEKDRKTPDMNTFLKRFVERKLVEAYEEWKCIYEMEIETAGRPYMVKIIKFKNSILWGDTGPDICKLNTSFREL